MVSTTSLKIFFAISIFIVILIAGWYPFRKRIKDDQHIDFPVGETLATGVFWEQAFYICFQRQILYFKKWGTTTLLPLLLLAQYS